MARPSKKARLIFALLVILLPLSLIFIFIPFAPKRASANEHLGCTPEKHVCVMKTMFDLEETPVPVKAIIASDLPAEVKTSITNGLGWITKAQSTAGGWGSGFHTRQD